jgi:hypothetical protein
MDEDRFDHAQVAADQAFAAAFVAGEAELAYDDRAPAPELPPLGTAVMVVRPVRLPADLDAAVRELAGRRDTTASALIRSWVEAALGEDRATDPVTELRRSLERAQRAAAEMFGADRHRAA